MKISDFSGSVLKGTIIHDGQDRPFSASICFRGADKGLVEDVEIVGIDEPAEELVEYITSTIYDRLADGTIN